MSLTIASPSVAASPFALSRSIEIPALRSRLAIVQGRHDRSKRFAAAARRGDWDGLAAVSSRKLAVQVQRLHEAGLIGTVDGDGGEEVRRLRGRIADLKADGHEAALAAEANGGILVIENAATGFVQLVFTAKASPAVRKLLKGHGFRFSELDAAWQRRADQAGREAAALVIAALAERGDDQ